MNLLDLVAAGQQLINFQRMLFVVAIGLMTIFIDGGLMKKKGLERESLWAKIFGIVLIVGSIGAWIGFMILG